MKAFEEFLLKDTKYTAIVESSKFSLYTEDENETLAHVSTVELSGVSAKKAISVYLSDDMPAVLIECTDSDSKI